MELLFDAGRRHALTEEARHAYEQNAANYRETVLQAFQEVEDGLSGLRILDSEAVAQQRAVESARRSLALSTNRYKGGVTTYLEVITAQTTQLSNERTARGYHHAGICRQCAADQGTGRRLGQHQAAYAVA